jgi:hypothetical protein
VFRLHSAMAVHEVSAVFHLVAADAFDRTTPAVLEAARLYSRRVPVVAARPLAAPAPPDGLSAARFGSVFGPGDRKLLRPVPATALALHAGEGVPPLTTALPRTSCSLTTRRGRACGLRKTRRGAAPCDHAFRTGWELSPRRMAEALREGFYGLAPRAPEPGPVANPLGWAPAGTFGARGGGNARLVRRADPRRVRRARPGRGVGETGARRIQGLKPPAVPGDPFGVQDSEVFGPRRGHREQPGVSTPGFRRAPVSRALDPAAGRPLHYYSQLPGSGLSASWCGSLPSVALQPPAPQSRGGDRRPGRETFPPQAHTRCRTRSPRAICTFSTRTDSSSRCSSASGR